MRRVVRPHLTGFEMLRGLLHSVAAFSLIAAPAVGQTLVAPTVALRTLGDPLPGEWAMPPNIHAATGSVVVTGTELQRADGQLRATLHAQADVLSLEICDGSSLGAASQGQHEAVFRRVRYEATIHPLEPGTYRVYLAGCPASTGEVAVTDPTVVVVR